jgi:uncharacterized protein YqeY
MSELMTKISNDMKFYQKEGKTKELNLLRTVYGELELSRLRNPDKFNDDEVIRLFKKFKAGVLETINALNNNGKEPSEEMLMELAFYDLWIPNVMPLDLIQIYLEKTILDQIKGAKSDGQAIGLAMGLFKKDKIPVEGKDVSTAVSSIRKAEEI